MIKINDYSLSLGEFKLNNINLKINHGEIFAVLGETGSGKTVLLEALAGFHQPFCGEVIYKDIPVSQIPLPDRKIGFVYQDYSLFPHMKVRENIEFGLKMRHIPVLERRNISKAIMQKLKIYHICDRYPETLSGGEKQRTALARALVLRPDVLFMDEPFSALDPSTRNRMYDIIRNIHEEYKCTIIFVTHNFQDVLALADRVGVMIKGSLRTVCKSEQLFEEHHDKDVMSFLGN